MKTETALGKIGLSKGEIKVYLALLKLGSSQVSKLKEETALHRTTIYDYIEKLLNKGLASYVIQNQVKHFKATELNKLSEYVKEKEELLKGIMPELKNLQKFEKQEVSVEVLRGKEGLKSVFNEVVRTGKDLIGLGIDETKFKDMFPVFMDQYFRNIKKAGVQERLLTSESPRFVFKKKTTSYRYIPKEYFNPTSTLVYGDKVVIIIWEPLTSVRIENPSLADSYKKYFEMVWQIASIPPTKKI
ncbi:MAG: helix-turn-helix domain-containing protein [Nanoarchaeota archaeon]